jgi:hypothetical protein
MDKQVEKYTGKGHHGKYAQQTGGKLRRDRGHLKDIIFKK